MPKIPLGRGMRHADVAVGHAGVEGRVSVGSGRADVHVALAPAWG